MVSRIGAVWTGMCLLLAPPAGAQSRAALEFTAGYAAFLDDSAIEYGLAGGAARFYAGPRVSIGPEAIYMRRAGETNVFLTGNVTYDFRARARGPTGPRVVPFVVAGGGFLRHRARIGSQTFTSHEGALTGGGVRVRLSERWHAAGDVRTGWEPHLRFSGTIGIGLGP